MAEIFVQQGGSNNTSHCETRRSCLKGQRRRTPLTGPTGCIRATWCSDGSERQRSDHLTSGVGFSRRVTGRSKHARPRPVHSP